MRTDAEIREDAIKAWNKINSNSNRDIKAELLRQYTIQLALELINEGEVNIPLIGRFKVVTRKWSKGDYKVLNYTPKNNLIKKLL